MLGIGQNTCIIAVVAIQASHTAPAAPGLWTVWGGRKAAGLERKVAPTGVKVVTAAKGRKAHSCMNLHALGLQ